MTHRLDVQGDIEWQKVGEGIHRHTVRHQRRPLRLHQEELRGGRLGEESGQRTERGRLVTPTAVMIQTRTGELAGAEQGAKRAGMIAFGLEWATAVRTGEAPVEKCLHLVLQEALLDGVEELFGLAECQAQMLDALGILP